MVDRALELLESSLKRLCGGRIQRTMREPENLGIFMVEAITTGLDRSGDFIRRERAKMS